MGFSIEVQKKIWVGKRIISIGNGYQVKVTEEPLYIGTVIDVVPLSQAQTPNLVVRYDHLDELVLTFACTILYDEGIWNALNKLTAKERWNLITSFANRF